MTITLDLAAGPLTPRLARLVDLLGELAETGEGVVRFSEPAAPRLLSAVPAPRPTPTVGEPVPADGGPETLRILAGTRVVRHGDREIPLTRIEFDLLLFLAEHPHRVFTRLQLLASVWGYEHAVVRTVDVHVRRLRAKLGADAPLVTTVYGVGYRLADDARVRIERFH
ncbi:winged helix-turn-helix domain-containing protein [Micromonospora sp. WMMD987]|uniref:winged helix-turn-helix domain-containing protein n=1 Tax=Micromonospora sp. WMMD987 TaxID=3016089 RepID=UPI002499C951|nr:winged helix-turn-helix domain-containing protein [Micromonospora sp. WMMD987]WFE98217.1 winged helix-turn-helix domain-containing protein [Micromonospora sp. WMMD987]